MPAISQDQSELFDAGITAIQRVSPRFLRPSYFARLVLQFRLMLERETAAAILDQALRDAVAPDTEISRVTTLVMISRAYASIGAVSSASRACALAFENCRKISRPPLRSQHFAQVALAYINISEANCATRILSELSSEASKEALPLFKAVAFAHCAAVYARCGWLNKAAATIRRVEAADFQQAIPVLVGATFAKEDGTSVPLHVAEWLDSLFPTDVVLKAKLADYYYTMGKEQAARDCLVAAHRQALQLKDHRERHQGISALARAYCALREKDRAVDLLLHEAVFARQKGHKIMSNPMLRREALAYVSADLLAKAIQAVHEIGNTNMRISTLEAIAVDRIRACRFDHYLELLNSVSGVPAVSILRAVLFTEVDTTSSTSVTRALEIARDRVTS